MRDPLNLNQSPLSFLDQAERIQKLTFAPIWNWRCW